MFDGELAPFSDNAGTGTGVQIDPAAFIQMRFALRLPGKIIETNGISDSSDPNRMVWTMMGKQSVHMSARSVTWNWINIAILGGIGGIFFLSATVGVGYVIYRSSKKNNIPAKLPGEIHTNQGINQPVSKLLELDIEDLLDQVNTRALGHLGKIQKSSREIVLAWVDSQGQHREIGVKDLGEDQIAINGKKFSATKTNAKAGILNVLKEQ